MNNSLAAGILVFATVTAPPATGAATLPTSCEAGHFYAVPETTSGRKLTLVVDTGGGGANGLYWITTAAAKRLRLKTTICGTDDQKLTVAAVPNYRVGHGLPPPLASTCGKVVLVQQAGAMPGSLPIDGQLGGAYLSGRVWTFDYPARRLLVQDTTWHPAAGAHATPLGFQLDSRGRKTSGFARIVIRVDGQPLDMLLDTGATAHPTAAGEQASDTPTVNGYGVASYITSGTLDHWHKQHPDWRVVANGDDLLGAKHPMRLIKVPKVEIAGWSVGPVWFTERPDANFHKFMAQWMDKAPEGAIGGNVFRHFVMTIDYPHATAYFRCVRGCKDAATPPPAP